MTVRLRLIVVLASIVMFGACGQTGTASTDNSSQSPGPSASAAFSSDSIATSSSVPSATGTTLPLPTQEFVSVVETYQDGQIEVAPPPADLRPKRSSAEATAIFEASDLSSPSLRSNPSRRIRFGLLTNNTYGTKRPNGSIDARFVQAPTWIITFRNVPMAFAGPCCQPRPTVMGSMLVAISDMNGEVEFSIEEGGK
ncbi:MAG: hypothetical protein ABIS47_00165 [Acidimicrobiales bacterium]